MSEVILPFSSLFVANFLPDNCVYSMALFFISKRDVFVVNQDFEIIDENLAAVGKKSRYFAVHFSLDFLSKLNDKVFLCH